MIPIHTKLLRGVFHCSATINGYDRLYSGKTMKEAQDGMKAYIKRNNVQNYIFEPLQIIPPKKKENKGKIPYVGYASTRIDNNPIA